MNRLFKLLMLGVAIALLVAIAVPIAAQDGLVEPSAPGEGGTIIQSNIGSDPPTFNPLIAGDTSSSTVWSYFYPAIIGLDLDFNLAPNVPQALAAGWEYDETGTILTLTLREDMFWSDGEQITADDYLWAVAATQSGVTSSPRTSALYELADGTISGGSIHEIIKIDDFTLQIELGSVQRDEAGEIILAEDGTPALVAACDAIYDVNDITVVPEHVFSERFGEDYAQMDEDPYFFPISDNGPATFGPFTDPFIEFGVQVSLLADQNYTDTTALDYVAPGEWIYQVVADQNVGYERFLAGDFTFEGISANNQNDFRALADETGDYVYLEVPQNGYTYVGLNLADPENPLPAYDEEGNLVDQGLHPIWSDLNVRLAFAHGIDTQGIIGTQPTDDADATGILEGNGYSLATHDHQVYSQTADLLEEAGVAIREYDPELAASLLEEAGWVDTNGDGIRECQGCLYATEVDPSFEGSDLTFELTTNAGNVLREAAAETIAVQLSEVGFNVVLDIIEWGSVLDKLTGQTHDAIIIGWSLGLPFVPGSSLDAIFSARTDLPGAGFGYTSWVNEEFEAILDEA
ncbi:MAG: ABC transporter substrate-binding protein, partial [Chloroflexota bacterium]